MKLTIPTEPHKKSVALSRYSERAEKPLIGVSLVFLITYTWQVIGDHTSWSNIIIESIMILTWAIFFVDFIVTMALTDKRKWFTPLNVVNLLIVLLPMFRVMRVLRVVSLLRVLNRSSAVAFRGNIMAFVVSSGVLLIYVGALAAFDAERYAEGAKIVTFGDSLWWAFITITTVGYGDFYPVTFEGRLISVGLTIAGISMIGIVTATMSVNLVKAYEQITKEELADEASDDLELELNKARLAEEQLAEQLEKVRARATEIEGEISSR